MTPKGAIDLVGRHIWALGAATVVVFLLIREWSPSSYRVVNSNVPLQQDILRHGDPIFIRLNRCNDTSQTAIFHYIRRLYNDETQEIYPLQEGNAPVDPGCRQSWIEVGDVPHTLPPGKWRIRSDNSSTNWLWKTTHARWVSDTFVVVGNPEFPPAAPGP